MMQLIGLKHHLFAIDLKHLINLKTDNRNNVYCLYCQFFCLSTKADVSTLLVVIHVCNLKP